MSQNKSEQKQISLTDLRDAGYKILLAAPLYGGHCKSQFMNSLLSLQAFCLYHGIHLGFHFINGESLITRARNYCADEFLSSNQNYTHMLFVDGDIEFSPHDVMQLLTINHAFPDRKIVVGPYPKKHISWEKVKLAVDAGLADENPKDLEKYTGDFVVGFKKDQKVKPTDFNAPIVVGEAGTGFMLIERSVLEEFTKSYPELMFRPDHFRSEKHDGSREIMCFFDTMIDPETKRYLSEDYFFIKKCSEIGIDTWMVPWIKLNHIGEYTYQGDLLALARRGISLTVNKNTLKKGK